MYFNLVLFILHCCYCIIYSTTTCGPNDFHYEFTECDEKGGRWRVSIPNGFCNGGNPPTPTRVDDCSASCSKGQYFNVSQLSCATCPAGTYSLGGGIIHQSFRTLPRDFEAHTEVFRSAFAIGRRRDVDCTQYEWHARNGVLASSGGPCAAVLVYTVKLVKPGLLSYSYQYTDNDIIFQFQAQNEQCQSIDDGDRAKWPSLTREGQWKTAQIQLTTGLNILHWKTIGVDARGSSRPVMIKSIEVTGVAYTSECSPCSAGTFSRDGASECKKCEENTFSHKRSSHCSKCDSELTFAPPGSSTCIKRPPCTTQDYYEIDSACDENNKTRALFRWVQPQVCRDEDPDSVQLPISGIMRTCPPCNTGMQFKNGKGCVFCPRGQFSDGLSECRNCPPNTEPDYRHQYSWWSDDLPPSMSATCMSAQETSCSSKQGWQPSGDHIHSGRGHAIDAYLVLSLKVAGFRGREGFINGQPMEVGNISFTFELMCSSECEFLFMEGSTTREVNILKSWKGQMPRHYYSHVITRNDSYTFSWAFQKIAWEASFLRTPSRVYESDMAKIFSINVTNTIDGGASSCSACAQGTQGFECIPCPPGNYINDKTHTCVSCPDNTVVTDSSPHGPQSCVTCGPSLTSTDRLSCTAQCNLTVDGSYIDLTNISQARVSMGSTLFTSSGTKYYHMFNLSLCSDQTITCLNNASYNLDMEMTMVKAKVCRSTIVPATFPSMTEFGKSPMSSLATQSVSLGDHLIGITKNTTLHGISVIQEFIRGDNNDINFFFTTPQSTRACPEGRSTTVTLRCAPEESGKGQITLPRQCPDGTCDGCSFHFLWSTPLACPICVIDDLIMVRGECKSGKQQIHYIVPDYCRQPDNLPQKEEVNCTTNLPFIVKVAILTASGITLFLSLLLTFLWNKNKRLEYKYMKLIANSSHKDGMMELPPAESCALQDGEEDEITFSKKKGILNKFKYGKGLDNLQLMEVNSNNVHS